ncbi:MAG: hypothetical protein FWC33_00805, partial [Candidatus Bathyarchaeota archaeon]|nr:hypothetical protein [Candidatus Termiticorpusculum sp.]
RPFTAYTDEKGNQINIYYTIWWKIPSDDDFVFWCSRSVYQSDSAYTNYTFTYGVEGVLPISIEYNDGGQIIDFRVQAVAGYFKQGIIYEGEGSAFSEFTITIPYKTGTSKPNIQPPSIVPTTSAYYNSPQQKLSSQSTLLIVLIASTSIISILLAVITYQHKQKKTNKQTNLH